MLLGPHRLIGFADANPAVRVRSRAAVLNLLYSCRSNVAELRVGNDNTADTSAHGGTTGPKLIVWLLTHSSLINITRLGRGHVTVDLGGNDGLFSILAKGLSPNIHAISMEIDPLRKMHMDEWLDRIRIMLPTLRPPQRIEVGWHPPASELASFLNEARYEMDPHSTYHFFLNNFNDLHRNIQPKLEQILVKFRVGTTITSFDRMFKTEQMDQQMDHWQESSFVTTIPGEEMPFERRPESNPDEMMELSIYHYIKISEPHARTNRSKRRSRRVGHPPKTKISFTPLPEGIFSRES